jgi:predicted ABC-type ATPase
MPSLFIITGSNGAGKSTVGYTYLPLRIQQKYTPFDGDKLLMNKTLELYPRHIRSLKEAKRQADEWVNAYFISLVNNALDNNDHFVYEGHFRNDDSWKIPRKFKTKGYYLSLLFMGLENPDQSELRVLERAIHGGHNVPRYEIESNFYGNLEKLNRKYQLFDELNVIDTSGVKPRVLLHVRDSEILFYVRSHELPDWFIKFLPRLFRLIKLEEKQLKNR